MCNVSKLAVVCLLVCTCITSSFAQKNLRGKGIKPGTKTPAASVAETIRPPLRQAEQVTPVSRVLQERFLTNWNVALNATIERTVLQDATHSRLKFLQVYRQLPGQEPLSPYAQKQIRFLQEDLNRNDHIWPSYAYGSDDIYVLQRIMNFMEVENPTPEVVEVQQEIIRLRAVSKALSPSEVLTQANQMLESGIVPQRAYMWARESYAENELALGEEIAFSVAAFKVPMENNPWQIPGMKELVDKVTTYNAMRRATPLFEGLPETYKADDGMQRANIPVLTQQAYAQQQAVFAGEHPFEINLAPYRVAYFGTHLHSVYNLLSPVEKQAILFTTPGLADPAQIKYTDAQYNAAVQQWIQTNGREPVSYLPKSKRDVLTQLLVLQHTGNYQVVFYNELKEEVPFTSLPYEQQLEVLMWAWKTHHLTPPQVLAVLGN